MLENVIYRLYPEYLESLKIILNSGSASYRNMFVMNREYLNDYCTWLFDILFELERNINIDNYTKQEKRIYGFIAEILLNVWTLHNKLKVTYINAINIETSPSLRMKNVLKYKCKSLLNGIGFKFKEKS